MLSSAISLLGVTASYTSCFPVFILNEMRPDSFLHRKVSAQFFTICRANALFEGALLLGRFIALPSKYKELKEIFEGAQNAVVLAILILGLYSSFFSVEKKASDFSAFKESHSPAIENLKKSLDSESPCVEDSCCPPSIVFTFFWIKTVRLIWDLFEGSPRIPYSFQNIVLGAFTMSQIPLSWNCTSYRVNSLHLKVIGLFWNQTVKPQTVAQRALQSLIGETEESLPNKLKSFVLPESTGNQSPPVVVVILEDRISQERYELEGLSLS